MRIRNPADMSVVPGPGHGELENILLRHVLGPAGQRLLHQQHSRRQQPHPYSPNHATKRREENEYKANKNYKKLSISGSGTGTEMYT
jgi:Zn-finger nucleic acid-binding protein